MNMTPNMQQNQGGSRLSVTGLHRFAAPLLLVALSLSGCKHEAASESAEAPPSPKVEEVGGSNLVHVDGAGRFTLVQASSQPVRSKLEVTGSVNPDVSREIPVLSLANGRVVALHVGLGDYVKKGQLVMEVQSPDVSTAFDAYLKAVNDEHLTTVTLDRDKLLFDKGAIPKSQLEAAQDGEDDAKADLIAAEQQLKILGVDKNHPSENVRIYAPASGVIIAQNVTASGAAGITYAGSTGSFTIADLSHVWVICDVYENDLANVHLGQHADIRSTPSPARPSPEPSVTSAPSSTPACAPPRSESRSRTRSIFSASACSPPQPSKARAPSSAPPFPPPLILQLHDRSYVFEPAGDGTFKRVQVKIGANPSRQSHRSHRRRAARPAGRQ